MRRLVANVCVRGRWYGPAHPSAGSPPPGHEALIGPRNWAELPDTDTPVPAADNEVPVGSVPDVLTWVFGAPDSDEHADGWEDRAWAALDVENGPAGRHRKGVIDRLRSELGYDS